MDDPRDLCPLFFLENSNSSETPAALNIFVALLNGIFLLIILISSALVVFVICHKPSLRTSSNILLASHVSASVAVSLLAQPSLIALEIEEILGDPNGYCTAQLLNIATSLIYILGSFLSVLGMSVNQYLALQFSAWHATKITSRNVAVMVILGWFVTTLTCSLNTIFGKARIFVFVVLVVAVLVMFLILVFSVKNYLIIRQCLMQVQQQLETPSNLPEVSTPNISRHQKTATTVFLILATYFVTYLPLFTIFVIAYIAGWSGPLKIAYIIALTVVYTSSALNSLICFRWNEEIRVAAFHALGY